MADYAWIIDKDHMPEPGAPPGTNLNAAGMTGPRDASEAHLQALAAGRGKLFRLYDDDEELYYEGRIIVDDWVANPEFQPLDDFGTPNAGCTTIKYIDQKTHAWEIL